MIKLRNIERCFQTKDLLDDLTVAENLDIPLSYREDGWMEKE